MNSFIRNCKFLKLSSAAVLESEKPVVVNVNAKYLLRHLHLFSTISDVVVAVDDDEKKPLPKETVIESRNIAELLKSSCGFPPEEAKALESRLLASTAKKKKKKPEDIENAWNVIEFFRDVGFSDTHIRKVISKRPKVLNSSVENTLKPKIRAFEGLGLSASEIGDHTSRHVCSLSRKPAIITAFFSKYCPRKEDVARLMKKMPPTWDYGRNFDPQISKFLEHGVSKEKVARSMLVWPDILFRNPEVIEKCIQKAYQFGFKYGDGMLMVAVKVLCSMNESTWESKFQVLRSYGWKHDDIVMAFHKAPFFSYMFCWEDQENIGVLHGRAQV